MRTWLLLDCNYLCYRAWYSTGSLQHNDLPTGVIYGFLRDITTLVDLYNTSRIAFCWDCGLPLRERDYPNYKLARRNKKAEESEDKAALREFFDDQVKQLRRKLLFQLGFKNNFYQRGYEADDVIASICTDDIYRKHDFVIVSADHDLYQLLSPRVTIHNPGANKTITSNSFSKEYGVSPTQWIDVKAIAGCSTDGIEGVRGVGEKTAAKFINGSLKATTKAFESITKNNDIWTRNRHLVKLPYPGVERFVLQKDNVQVTSWQQLTDKLGMKTLRERLPQSKGKGFGVF